MAQCRLVVTVRLPWTWRLYIWSARIGCALGIPVDPDHVAHAIVRKARFDVVKDVKR